MEDLILEKIIDHIKSIKPFIFKHLIRPGLVKTIIPSGSYYLLVILKKRKIATMKDLGIELLMLKSNVTALINVLIAWGLVERLPSTQDRRIVKVQMTPKGLKALSDAKKIIFEDVKDKLSDLTESDLTILASSLKNIKKVLSKIDLNAYKGEQSVISLQRQHFRRRRKRSPILFKKEQEEN